jgi:glutamine synthetase
VLYRRGYLLSFMPKPLPDLSGTGLHVNLSFRDQDGNNAMHGGTRNGALSELVQGCIAGLMQHHESMGALLAPTVNSYDRLKPASLCGYWANWGYDHRGVAVRVSAEEGTAARIEHRVADCAASPYVIVAAVLQAARLGLENGYELPPAETGDGLETVNTERHVPDSLPDALAALEKDAALVDAIGRLLVENFIAIKQAEIEETSGRNPAEIFDYYAPFL